MQTQILEALRADRLAEATTKAAELLAAGELVAFPTETVYGLGANALDPEAIERIFVAKGRPSDNPLIVHLSSYEEIDRCGVADRRAMMLAERFMPGPLTLVLPARSIVPANARAGLPTVALRVPDHPVAAALLARSGPLVAPSANLSGHPSPTSARHVLDDLGGRIAAILDGGPCRVGIESTVVDLSTERPSILRPGTITAAQIEAVVGELMYGAPADMLSPKAPGMKYRHYAPSIPVRLLIQPDPPTAGRSGGRRLVLTTPRHRERFPRDEVRPLSERELYGALREADRAGLDEVIIYAMPGELPPGLLDRVRRAAGL